MRSSAQRSLDSMKGALDKTLGAIQPFLEKQRV